MSKTEVTFRVEGFTLTGEVDSNLVPFSKVQEQEIQGEMKAHAIRLLNGTIEQNALPKKEVLWRVEDE